MRRLLLCLPLSLRDSSVELNIYYIQNMCNKNGASCPIFY